VTFITGSDRAGKEWSDEAWKKLATATDTVCVLMGMRRIEEIATAMLAGGRSPETPVAVIQWGARPAQRVVRAPLARIAEVVRECGVKNPAVIVVGEVVKLRDELAWYDREPLFGKNLLLFRPEEQGRDTARSVRERGAEAVLIPMIEVAAPPEREPLERALDNLSAYGWVLFTSANGVERFFLALAERGRDARALCACKVGVIGPKTRARLQRFGVRADVEAEEFVGEGLACALLASGPPSRVLLARALVARDALPDALREASFDVDVVPVYETRSLAAVARARLLEEIETGRVDAALFTSSSTVEQTVAALGSDAASVLARVTVACIGPITWRALDGGGVMVDVAAMSYTLDGLVDGWSVHFGCHPRAPTQSR
jgi:uroporphyrinogen III methyltransferase/synthase